MAVLLLSVAVQGQTLNTLPTFEPNLLGYRPISGVTIGPLGQLYCTTQRGGASDLGIAFELTPPASPSGAWTEIVLHSFSSLTGDGNPNSALVLGSSGALYGVTGYNGSAGAKGTVFELKPPEGSNTHWIETVLHTFTPPSGDGLAPAGSLVLGPHNSLYGTTVTGADSGGIVFRLQPSAAGDWTTIILHSFHAYLRDAAVPAGNLALASDGTIYGAGSAGGSDGLGAVFELDPPTIAGGNWTESLLHSFTSEASDPGLPNGVVLGPNGVLYGTSLGQQPPKDCDKGCGAVFQLTPPAALGGAWTETILHSFTGIATGDGSQPNSELVLAPAGILYGTTRTGGVHNYGTIFEMVPPSSPEGTWTEVVLYSFTNGADGSQPNAVTLGPDGALYGTTAGNGTKDSGGAWGSVFQMVLP